MMNLYEKTLAQRERKEPKMVYTVTRVPVSDRAKKYFGIYDYTKVLKSTQQKAHPDIEKYNKYNESQKEKNTAVFQYVYYYEDPTETEKEREQFVINQSTEVLNRNMNKGLELGIDYEVTVERMDI